MSLKDTIQADINRVFLNMNEFAETHRVDGKLITCVLDDPSMGTTNVGTDPYKELGLTYGDYVLRAATDDLPKKYKPNQAMQLDGKPMLTIKVVDAMGMTYITLKEHTTW